MPTARSGEFDTHLEQLAAAILRTTSGLDACEAAIGHGSTDVEPIAKMLADLLGNEGLVRLTPANEPFDPNLHDAVMHEEGDGGEPIVIETLRTGYQWKTRVLRPAMVKVKG